MESFEFLYPIDIKNSKDNSDKQIQMDHALYGEKRNRREHINDCIIRNLAKWHNLIIYLLFTAFLLCAGWLPGIPKNKGKNPEDFDVRKS